MDTSVHEGKKPFQCNICDASFTRNNHFYTHVVSFHERKKAISMQYFTRNTYLNELDVTVHELKKKKL